MASLLSMLAASSLAAGAAFASSLHGGPADRIRERPHGTTVASAAQVMLDLEDPYRRVVLALRNAGVGLATNSWSCRTKDVVGFHTYRSGRIELCSDRIRRITSDKAAYRQLLQETLVHEAAHVAQFCRADRTGGPPSVGIAAAKLYALPPNQQQDLRRALGMATHNLPRSLAWRQEAEAFYLEDKPDEVARMLARYC